MKLIYSSVVVLAVGFGALALAACSSSSSSSGNDAGSGADGGSGGEPTVAITSPTANAQITLTPPADTVPIAFAVTNFTLRDANTCNGLPNCGHVHLFVDDTACNGDAGGSYNNFGSMSPLSANLTMCAMVNGPHTAKTELHNDDHSLFKGADGGAVFATVAFTASGG